MFVAQGAQPSQLDSLERLSYIQQSIHLRLLDRLFSLSFLAISFWTAQKGCPTFGIYPPQSAHHLQ